MRALANDTRATSFAAQRLEVRDDLHRNVTAQQTQEGCRPRRLLHLRQGLTITNSLAYTLVLSAGSLVGCALGAYLSDAVGRRWSIIGASVVTIAAGYIYARFNAGDNPTIVLSVGFVLIVAIYIQTAILFGVYTPELFPTEIRLRANGICNTLGRGATVVSPFIVGALMASYQLPGVIWLMIGLVVVQIVVVWLWGVEPRNRGLEEVAGAAT